MGFRSTFITEDLDIEMPQWFIDKWSQIVNFNGRILPISSKCEAKEYEAWNELVLDLQKILNEGDSQDPDPIALVYLHECGGVTRVEIHHDKIFYTEPIEWQMVENVSHSYCYGCSDAERYLINKEEKENSND